MKISEAQRLVDNQINSYGGYWQPGSMFLRLIEEVGELARAINIKYGDKKSKSETDGREVATELADVFYTTTALANINHINLEEEIKNLGFNSVTIEKLQDEFSTDNKNNNKLFAITKLITKVG